jgi:hypothetical protein
MTGIGRGAGGGVRMSGLWGTGNGGGQEGLATLAAAAPILASVNRPALTASA